MKQQYVIISKTEVTDTFNVGKQILVSFASKPLWQAFYWLYVQGYKGLSSFDMETAKYALSKYANPKDFEIIPLEQAQEEYKQFSDTIK